MTDKADNDALIERLERLLPQMADPDWLRSEELPATASLVSMLPAILAALRTPQPEVDGPSDGEIYSLASFGGDKAAKDAFVAESRDKIDRALAAEDTPQPECTSCHGLNTSCPEGCERDPATGELLFTPQPDETETLRVEVARLREALGVADAAIKEMFRYYDGGETRGSYDGKPERNQLRKAGYATTAALKGTDHGRG